MVRPRKRLLVFSVVSVVALGGIGAGLWWFYKNTGTQLLEKTEVALRASRYDKALDLAKSYVQERPNDWQGYYYQAQAYIGKGMHEEARKALEQAAKVKPSEVSVTMLNAETYAVPARKGIASKDLSQIRQAVEQFQKAEELLSRAESNNPGKVADMQTRAGLLQIETGRALGVLAARLREEETVAKGRGDANAARWAGDGNDVAAKSAQAFVIATKTFLEVVQRDANRAEAATALVQLCLERRDQPSLEAARKAILAVPDPAPIAAMMLVLEDLQSSAAQAGPARADVQKIKAACQVLDDILTKHPDNTQVKATRADLAVRASDLPKAKQLCEEVLKAEPRNPRARLTQAEVLLLQGDLVEAEKKLSGLRAEVSMSPEVQFAFARVSLALGKRDAVEDALRGMAKVGSKEPRHKLMQAQIALALSDLPTAKQLCLEAEKLSPGNPGARLLYGTVLARSGDLVQAERVLSALRSASPQWPEAHLAYAEVADQKGDSQAALSAAQDAARLDPENAAATMLLARLQMRAGDPNTALTHAQRYYQSHPNDSVGLTVLVEAAVRANQADLARTALEKAVADHATQPDMLMAACEAYLGMGDRAAATKLAKSVADMAPTNTTGRMAKARALELTDRLPEAEKLLADELKRDPSQAGVRYQMGRLCAAGGRLLPAIDHYRAASDLDRGNAVYRETLARALLDSGDVAESRRVLDTIGASSSSVNLLKLRVRLIQQEPVDIGQMLQEGRGGEKSAMAMALPYLAAGQLQQCVDYCQSELVKKPDDAGLRLILARAFLAMGQDEKAIEQWEKVLQAAPGQLATYLELASVLGRGGDFEGVATRMSGISGAKPEMVNLAVAGMLTATGSHAKAIELLTKIAQSKDTPEHILGRVKVLLARSLAAVGQVERSLAELDSLSDTAAFRKEAMVARAGILAAAQRSGQAEEVLASLAKMAAEDKDGSFLRRIADLHAQMRNYDKALSICGQLQELEPQDSRNYQLRAAILTAAGKPAEAIECRRKAAELQPQDFSLQIALARALDAEQQSTEALEVLRKMEEAGPAAASQAVMQRGLMLARWGLQDQAAECFAKLSGLGYGSHPGVQLALGQCYIGLGRPEKAMESLKQIPAYGQEYVPARLLLARLAPSDDARLRAIRELRQAKPQSEEALLEEMGVLLRGGQPGEAVKAFGTFLDRRTKGAPLPAGASFLAIQSMVESGDAAGARDLALRLAKETNELRWRHLASMLAMDDPPQAALDLLPKPEEADALLALAGFCLARRANDAPAEKAWLERFAGIEKQASPAQRSALAPDRLLIHLIRGETDQAKSALAQVSGVLNFGKSIAAEQLASTRPTADLQAECLSLLKSSVALRTGLPMLTKVWSSNLLKARPTCQWAAVLAFHSDARPAARQQVLDALQPKDCTAALFIRAEMLRAKGEFAEAAGLYAQVAKVDGSLEATLNQAICLEYAGRLEEALAIYRQAWQASRVPAAANNAAYVTIRLFPKDQAKLGEAQTMIEEALKARPGDPMFQDTLGWISYLRGNYAQACTELRKAVRGSPQSMEIQYHLAMAESACGRIDLARWHHRAAINIGKMITSQGKALTAEYAQVVALSQQALDALGPPK